MLAIDRIGVPPTILAALKHLASLHNPEFYEKEKLAILDVEHASVHPLLPRVPSINSSYLADYATKRRR